eukprot:gene9538-6695_t
MIRGVEDIAPELIDSISPSIERFITDIKSGRIGGYRGTSLSTAAAQAMVSLMSSIIERFQEFENEAEDAGSPTLCLRQKGLPEVEVVSNQVKRLLHLIARTSDALIRPQFGTLLLTNVTRRVLSIIRDAAVEAQATEEEITCMRPNSPPIRFSCEGSASGLPMDGEEAKIIASDDIVNGAATAADADAAEALLSASINNGLGFPSQRTGSNPMALQRHGVYPNSFTSPTDTKIAAELPGHHPLRRAKSSWQDLTSIADLAAMGSPCSASDINVPSGRGALSPPTLAAVASHPNSSAIAGAPFYMEHQPSVAHEFPVRLTEFYDGCLRGLEELGSEVAAMTDELCKRVERQIHRGDVIISIGCTHTVRQYLLAASNLQRFRVVLLDGAPTPLLMVDQLAAELRARGVEVQRLPDSSAFAVMNTCTKVVIGAESVLANGGMLAPIGSRLLCVAARHFAVPVLVATTTLKMSPYYPSDPLCTRLVRITKAKAQELPWSIYGAPELILPMPNGVWVDCCPSHRPANTASFAAINSSQRGSNVGTPTAAMPSPRRFQLTTPSATVRSPGHGMDREVDQCGFGWNALRVTHVCVHCAATEYVPPEYVTLYATNEAELAPSQCHRIIRANYNDAD